MTEVVVVGGGLAGLVAARRLAAADHEVTLYEQEATVGGRVRSVKEDGFTYDRGFQVLFPGYPAVERELDLDALDLRSFKPGAILARAGERTTLADPLRDPGALVATVLNRDVTLGDKLRVFQLRRDLSGTSVDEIAEHDDQTVAAFLESRGFSRKFVDRFARPFYGGITLDRSLSSSRLVFEYTFKMLTEGPATVPAGGMGAITQQLAEFARDAGATVETSTTVTAVQPDGEGVTVETPGEQVGASAAIVATDPETARELTGCSAIQTAANGCVTQYFSLPDRQELDIGRRLVLNTEHARPNQVALLTAVAPEYAPAGTQLLSATFLGRQDADDEALASEVSEQLASWFPENSFADLELRRTDRIPFAQLEQQPGFTDEWPAVDDPPAPVYLAGDYTQWSSIQGALESGRVAARTVQDTLSV